MYIKSVEFLDDYRQFKKGDKIELSINMNILVGPNGIGKSTILKAIYEYFEKNYYNNAKMKIIFGDAGKRLLDLFFNFIKDNNIDVGVYDEQIFEKISSYFKNQDNDTFIIENNDYSINGNKFDILFLDKDIKSDNPNYIKIQQTNSFLTNFSRNIHKLFIDRFHLIMVNDKDDSLRYIMNTYEEHEGSLLGKYCLLNTREITKYSTDYLVKYMLRTNNAIFDYVQARYNEITGKYFLLKFHENQNKNFDQHAYTIYELANSKFYNSHRYEHNIGKNYTECSSGEIDMIKFLTLTSENDFVDVLLIDEPGKSLSQIYLQQMIDTLNNESQIIMVTHNPKIINKDCIRKENTTFIYFCKKNANIKCLNVKNEMKKLDISYDILVNNRDILFVNECICVEGISDYKVIRHFVQDRHIEIMYGGDSKLKELLKSLEIKYWIVFDLDKLCNDNNTKVFENMGAKEVKRIVRDKGIVIKNNYEIVKFEDKKMIGFANKNFVPLKDKDIEFIQKLLNDNIVKYTQREDRKSMIIFLKNNHDEIKEFKNIIKRTSYDEYIKIHKKENKKNNIYYHDIQFVDIEGYFDDIGKKELQNKTDDEIVKMIKDNHLKFKDLYDFLNDGETDINYDDFIKQLF